MQILPEQSAPVPIPPPVPAVPSQDGDISPPPSGQAAAMVRPGEMCERQLPVVPIKNPRPLEGNGLNQRLSLGRAGAENAPIASVIDSLRGNDAAFEVILGQARIVAARGEIANRQGTALIAVGDPSVVDFLVLPNTRMIRVTGRRVGVTDLSITTADGQTYGFEVRVMYDLDLLRGQLRQVFPNSSLKISQIREHLVVEGEARSTEQASQIIKTIGGFLESIHAASVVDEGGTAAQQPGNEAARPIPAGNGRPQVVYDAGGGGVRAIGIQPRIINLIRIPGVHQVLLKVRIAELNRTATRQIGANILGVNPNTGNIMGTSIGGASVNALSTLGLGGLVGKATSTTAGTPVTAFGVFPSGNFEILLTALEKNNLLSIMAEPNLMTMSGHRASFLAGGQFPVPVPQSSGGASNSTTIEWKDFGVQLDFLPFVIDEETIRMTVTPEVSSIDYALGTTLVLGGSPVPGLNTRRASTTVELRQGQTLAIAGLLQVQTDGQTSRIPGLGDLPIIGPMFSNTTHNRQEKELVVLVTPYLVGAMNPCQVPALPGSDIKDPTAWEFYFLNRIEGRRRSDYRATVPNSVHYDRRIRMEQQSISGPMGFSE